MAKINDSNYLAGALSWIVEPGCSVHMTFDRNTFVTYTETNCGEVEMGTKAKANIAGRGDVVLEIVVNSQPARCKFQNVLHVPSLQYSLLSVPTLD